MDPVELRRRNLIRRRRLSGDRRLRHQVREALAPCLARQDPGDDGLRRPARRAGASCASAASIAASASRRFIEVTNPSAAFYGVGGARISSQDGATLRLDATGAVFVPFRRHRAGPGRRSGAGAMRRRPRSACRSSACASSPATPTTRPMAAAPGPRARAGIGGEAAWQAGKALRANVLAAAGAMLQAEPGDARHQRRRGRRRRQRPRAPAARGSRARRLFPPRHAAARLSGRVRGHAPLRAARLAVRLHQRRAGARIWKSMSRPATSTLKHWCVEDCGTVINPQLVDEQIRGGIVQGIGGALYEHCLYDEPGQLINGNMMDYLVPMAVEMPDIEVGHVVTPTAEFRAGRQGRGRGRHRRRAGRHDERDQRRARARSAPRRSSRCRSRPSACSRRWGICSPLLHPSP